MTDPPARPNRRATDGSPLDTPRARQRRLVQHISNDAALIGWLATSKARTLNAVAADLADKGMTEAAELVHRKADAIEAGTLSPF